MQTKVDIAIASHNMRHLLVETLESCLKQDYPHINIIVLDDASTDKTDELFDVKYAHIKYFRSDEPSGTGEAFNKAISHATGDIVVLMCADDLFTDTRVISDMVKIFDENPKVGHITRYYHQFVDGDRTPVRAWRCNDVMELANNPSGLAFRRALLMPEWCRLSNRMFVEASTLVNCVLLMCDYHIMKWDTVAVRIHKSISRSPAYYQKRWTSSPVSEWSKVGGSAISMDFTSLIQIKNYFTEKAVLEEVGHFIRLRPLNLINPAFWFFSLVALLTPRSILFYVPEIYRRFIGRYITGEVKRP